MKIVSGHQPAYLPWLGLFHKLSLCDAFVFMDCTNYDEQTWMNRNRIRLRDGSVMLTVPIDRRQSNKARETSKNLGRIILQGHHDPGRKDFWQRSHWRSIELNYCHAPYFDLYSPELRDMYLETVWVKLVDLCWAQFNLFRGWLGLDGIEVVRMSQIGYEGKKDSLVLDFCKTLGGDAVVFGARGRDYVDLERFENEGVRVHFQQFVHPAYGQRFPGFEPYMCVLDLLFNSGENAKDIIMMGNLGIDELRSGEYWEPYSNGT